MKRFPLRATVRVLAMWAAGALSLLSAQQASAHAYA
jgi:hypothetical protein